MSYRDRMMEELHAIRRRHAEETAHLSDEEYVTYLHETVERELAQLGYRLVAAPDGTERLQKVEGEKEKSPSEEPDLNDLAHETLLDDEILATRRRLALEVQDLPPEAATYYIKTQVNEFLADAGYCLLPLPKGTFRIEKIDNSRRTA